MRRHGVTQVKQVIARRNARCGGRQCVFLTNVNRAAAIAARMKFDLQQEDVMGAKSKSAMVRGAARKHAAKTADTRRRRAATASEAWGQAARISDDRDDEIDCQRIVQGDGSRCLPRHYDDCN